MIVPGDIIAMDIHPIRSNGDPPDKVGHAIALVVGCGTERGGIMFLLIGDSVTWFTKHGWRRVNTGAGDRITPA